MRCFRLTPGPSPTRFRARLSLETLDARLPPSSLLDDPVPPPPPPVVFPPPTPPVSWIPGVPTGNLDAPPQIVNFIAVEVAGGLWRFTGTVLDEAPGGLTVRFGGDPSSLQSRTVTTDASGHFDLAVLLSTNGSDNGLASAQTADAAGQLSNLALYGVSPG